MLLSLTSSLTGRSVGLVPALLELLLDFTPVANPEVRNRAC